MSVYSCPPPRPPAAVPTGGHGPAGRGRPGPARRPRIPPPLTRTRRRTAHHLPLDRDTGPRRTATSGERGQSAAAGRTRSRTKARPGRRTTCNQPPETTGHPRPGWPRARARGRPFVVNSRRAVPRPRTRGTPRPDRTRPRDPAARPRRPGEIRPATGRRDRRRPGPRAHPGSR